MSKCPTLVLATANAHKVTEMRALLKDCGWDAQPAPAEVADVDETGGTFKENARIKALHTASALNAVALADDSGLVVDALDGAPGVYSKRWAGPDATDGDRIAKLLDALRDVPDSERSARFVCAACIAGPSGVLWDGQGTVEGRIAWEPRGNGGFGYDPVFLVEDGQVAMAELTEGAKNAISHRGRALSAAAEWLRANATGNT